MSARVKCTLYLSHGDVHTSSLFATSCLSGSQAKLQTEWSTIIKFSPLALTVLVVIATIVLVVPRACLR